MKIRAVDFVSYNVSDPVRSERFFREVLGLTPTAPWPGTGFPEFTVGETSVFLTNLPQLGQGGALALAVADVRDATEELRAAGVEIAQEPLELGPCFLAIVLDPDGNRIIVHQRKDGSAG